MKTVMDWHTPVNKMSYVMIAVIQVPIPDQIEGILGASKHINHRTGPSKRTNWFVNSLSPPRKLSILSLSLYVGLAPAVSISLRVLSRWSSLSGITVLDCTCNPEAT